MCSRAMRLRYRRTKSVIVLFSCLSIWGRNVTGVPSNCTHGSAKMVRNFGGPVSMD